MAKQLHIPSAHTPVPDAVNVLSDVVVFYVQRHSLIAHIRVPYALNPMLNAVVSGDSAECASELIGTFHWPWVDMTVAPDWSPRKYACASECPTIIMTAVTTACRYIRRWSFVVGRSSLVVRRWSNCGIALAIALHADGFVRADSLPSNAFQRVFCIRYRMHSVSLRCI